MVQYLSLRLQTKEDKKNPALARTVSSSVRVKDLFFYRQFCWRFIAETHESIG